MARGTFLVVEGTDGSDKDAQVVKLTERLEREGYEVVAFNFPQYQQPSSYFIHEYQKGKYGSDEEVGPYTGSLFYALDRYQAAPEIRKAIEAGKVVIANRFTGSNMAHHGTKFAQSEHRRGYFIWLDNLEYEMLKIPRPDRSIVLRAPTETAQPLTEVYDDLCQLFPKDFIRIDCFRDKKLLDAETIHALLWQTIEPLLPSKPEKQSNAVTTKPVSVTMKQVDQQKESSTQPQTDESYVIEKASSLLINKLEGDRVTVVIRQASFEQKDETGKYRYYIPKAFDAKTKATYLETMDRIFDLYAEMVKKVTSYIRNNSDTPKEKQDDSWRDKTRVEAYETMRTVLPVAATSAIDVTVSSQVLERTILRLISDDLPEARDVAKQLLTKSHKTIPALLNYTDRLDLTAGTMAYTAKNRHVVQELADLYLPENHASETDPVTLTSVWPRNELDLIPDMLYGYSNLSLKDLQDEVATWPIDRRMDIFEAYVGKRLNRYDHPGDALEKAYYNWDIVSDYATFSDLQRYQSLDRINWQLLTPRYGYDIPQLVEDAGLLDHFEECFDLSLQLYSTLQAAGFTAEAQYATLFGHRMRWKVAYNASGAFHVHERYSRPGAKKLLQTMHERLAEVHPMIAEAMKFVNQA